MVILLLASTPAEKVSHCQRHYQAGSPGFNSRYPCNHWENLSESMSLCHRFICIMQGKARLVVTWFYSRSVWLERTLYFYGSAQMKKSVKKLSPCQMCHVPKVSWDPMADCVESRSEACLGLTGTAFISHTTNTIKLNRGLALSLLVCTPHTWFDTF